MEVCYLDYWLSQVRGKNKQRSRLVQGAELIQKVVLRCCFFLPPNTLWGFKLRKWSWQLLSLFEFPPRIACWKENPAWVNGLENCPEESSPLACVTGAKAVGGAAAGAWGRVVQDWGCCYAGSGFHFQGKAICAVNLQATSSITCFAFKLCFSHYLIYPKWLIIFRNWWALEFLGSLFVFLEFRAPKLPLWSVLQYVLLR